MRELSLRQLQILKLYYKKKFCKTTTLCCCYNSIKILIIKSYSLKSKQKDVNFKQNKIFVSLKTKTNILKKNLLKQS
jgi:hypothetical protein